MVGEGRQAVREVLGRKDGGRARDRGRLERKRALGCRFRGGGVFEKLLEDWMEADIPSANVVSELHLPINILCP